MPLPDRKRAGENNMKRHAEKINTPKPVTTATEKNSFLIPGLIIISYIAVFSCCAASAVHIEISMLSGK